MANKFIDSIQQIFIYCAFPARIYISHLTKILVYIIRISTAWPLKPCLRGNYILIDLEYVKR